MKSIYTALLIAASSYCFADILEIRDAGTVRFTDGKAAHVALQKIPDSEFYIGYRLDAQKSESGSVSIHVTNVALLGFVELEPGKRSPLTKSEEKKIEIQQKSAEWTEIETPQGLKLSVRLKK